MKPSRKPVVGGKSYKDKKEVKIGEENRPANKVVNTRLRQFRFGLAIVFLSVNE